MVVRLAALAVGPSFAGVTLIETTADKLRSRPSLTVNVNESGPEKFGLGVYENEPFGLMLTSPLVGRTEPTANVSRSRSISSPVSVPVSGVSSTVDVLNGLAIGKSFNGDTVMVTVAGNSPRIPNKSRALYVKVSTPLKLGLGVYSKVPSLLKSKTPFVTFETSDALFRFTSRSFNKTDVPLRIPSSPMM